MSRYTQAASNPWSASSRIPPVKNSAELTGLDRCWNRRKQESRDRKRDCIMAKRVSLGGGERCLYPYANAMRSADADLADGGFRNGLNALVKISFVNWEEQWGRKDGAASASASSKDKTSKPGRWQATTSDGKQDPSAEPKAREPGNKGTRADRSHAARTGGGMNGRRGRRETRWEEGRGGEGGKGRVG
ncbi:hypothetical protein C8R44DRAFT_749179 [Mycena epipterygia]|nr:hypothetical protein C8R44DRAFT_749179 [Mycena epipterygia]